MRPSWALFSVGLFALGLDCGLRAGNPGIETEGRAAVAARAAESLGRMALRFEANEGQFDSRVRFLARGRDSRLFLTDSGAVLAFRKQKPPDSDPKAAWQGGYRLLAAGERAGPAESVVRMRLMGGSPEPTMEGLERLPGISNYFFGNDPAQWRTHVPTYAKVRARGVYPGVDLYYYGNAGRLEYDFVVQPGADAKSIEVAFEGVDRMRVNEGGSLVLETALGEVQWQRPVAYQEENGLRRPVEAAYVLRNGWRVAFEVARYDPARPLVIDPVLVYSTFLAGNGFESGEAVTADRDGNVYVAGITSSSDYPTTAGVQQPGHGGYEDAYLTKLNPAGSTVMCSTYLGGKTKADDKAYGISVDAAGNVYLTGGTISDDFPTTAEALQRKKRPGVRRGDAGVDAFVAKLNPSGSALLYSTYLGGNDFEEGTGIGVDGSGNAYVTGETRSKDFPVLGAVQWTHGGGTGDAFVTKLNAAGSGLLFSTYLGGGRTDCAEGIAVDPAGRAYITGHTFSSNFPTTPGAVFPTTSIPAEENASHIKDAFATALESDGSVLVYSTYLGGRSTDEGKGIAVDESGQAYVTGETWSDDFPTTPGSLNPTMWAGFDAFVVKLNATGSRLVYSTYIQQPVSAAEKQHGSLPSNKGFAIAVDALGHAYITGITSDADFITTEDAWQRKRLGSSFNQDAFLVKLSPSGSSLVYSTLIGGSDREQGEAVAVDPSGSVYVTGRTESEDFPTHNAVQPEFVGTTEEARVGVDGWLVKISTVFQPPPGTVLEGSTAVFEWAPQEGVSGYYLKVGTTRDGGDIYERHEGGNLSVTVTGLPVDGRTIYVRLFCQVGDAWKYLEATYKAGGSGAAVQAGMISPPPGSTLPGATVTFQWSAGAGVDQYYLRVGSTREGKDIYDRDQGRNTSATVSGIPTDGRTIYVRLFSRTGENWHYEDYTYTAHKAAAGPAEMTSPAPGSTLAGSTVTFQWSAGSGVDQYYLKVGSTSDGGEIFQKDMVLNLSATVSGIPTDGRTIYVRLFSRIGENWHYRDYTYTAHKAAAGPAEMTSPAPGSTLAGSTVTFQWSAGSGVDQYYLKVGSTRDGGDIFQKDMLRSLSATVSGIPTDGRTIYVRLFSRIGENWHYQDYTYTAQKSVAPPAAGFVISNLRFGTVKRDSFLGTVTLPMFVDYVDPSGKAACDWLERDILLSAGGSSIHIGGKVRKSGVACQTSGTLDLTNDFRGAFFRSGITVSVKVTLINALGHKSNELTGSFRS